MKFGRRGTQDYIRQTNRPVPVIIKEIRFIMRKKLYGLDRLNVLAPGTSTRISFLSLWLVFFQFHT